MADTQIHHIATTITVSDDKCPHFAHMPFTMAKGRKQSSWTCGMCDPHQSRNESNLPDTWWGKSQREAQSRYTNVRRHVPSQILHVVGNHNVPNSVYWCLAWNLQGDTSHCVF